MPVEIEYIMKAAIKCLRKRRSFSKWSQSHSLPTIREESKKLDSSHTSDNKMDSRCSGVIKDDVVGPEVGALDWWSEKD